MTENKPCELFSLSYCFMKIRQNMDTGIYLHEWGLTKWDGAIFGSKQASRRFSKLIN